MQGSLASDRVCHIRMSDEEVVKYYGPDLPATAESGECVTVDGELAPAYASITPGRTAK